MKPDCYCAIESMQSPADGVDPFRGDQYIPSALAESYGYDPLGRRAWTYDGSVTNWHVHDSMHIVADLDDTGAVLRSYTWGPGIDNMLGMVSYKNGETNAFFFVTDHLGTVHAVLDDSGAVVESYEFDAWGRVLAVRDANGNALDGSAIGNRILFQGREFSWTSGLYFFRARYYDPCLGRWTGKDPIGIRGGANQYVAFDANPVSFRDPDGKWVWHVVGAVVGGGLDIAVQTLVEGKSFSEVNWVSVGVSAASGAVGVGLGNAVTRIVGQTAMNGAVAVAALATLNAAGSAAIGATGRVINNAAGGDPLGQGVASAAGWSGLMGGGASILTDVGPYASRLIPHQQGTPASTIFLDQRGAFDSAWRTALRNPGPIAVGTANVAGQLMANAPYVRGADGQVEK